VPTLHVAVGSAGWNRVVGVAVAVAVAALVFAPASAVTVSFLASVEELGWDWLSLVK